MSLTVQWVKEVCGRQVVFMSDGTTACVRYKRYGHTYNFGGPIERKLEVIRSLSLHAIDTDDPFTWWDALIVRDAINDYWPEIIERPVKEEVCQCHACRCRREADSEAEAVRESKTQTNRKIDWLGVVFMVVVFMRTRFRRSRKHDRTV